MPALIHAPAPSDQAPCLAQFQVDVQAMRDAVAAVDVATLTDPALLAQWVKLQLEDNLLPLLDSVAMAVRADLVGPVAELATEVQGLVDGATEVLSEQTGQEILGSLAAGELCCKYLLAVLKLADAKTGQKARAAVADFRQRAESVILVVEELIAGDDLEELPAADPAESPPAAPADAAQEG